ncbi:hypothetical protein AVEN_271637-1, partial [Araneus ventricosus]
ADSDSDNDVDMGFDRQQMKFSAQQT